MIPHGGRCASRSERLIAGWLTLIAISLVTTGHYFDVAVRDLVMAAGAFTLARVSETRRLSPVPASA